MQPIVKLRGEFVKVRKAAKEFCAAHELEERDFAYKRLRKNIKIPGEVCSRGVEESTKI